ncbi:DinB family protein [Algoriphagus litoralis]|uniref:DinB family protein n=1 Tax=Algoriphagus litoralis TaxID=2202829 RepID=UPI001300943B|nr:DinB family protein [Algoriphagus litoralis]
MLAKACALQLQELSDLLDQLPPERYSSISPVFRTASVGQHVRHIIELFECLIHQYESGQINYDLRTRDPKLENDLAFALDKIRQVQSNISLPDRDLTLFQDQSLGNQGIKTTFFRELLYNLEHCVHHQALIRLACQVMPEVIIPVNFGVAKSTQTYHSQLASNN